MESWSYKDVLVYLAVKENCSDFILKFSSCYDISGISMIFMECRADHINSDFDCDFVRQVG